MSTDKEFNEFVADLEEHVEYHTGKRTKIELSLPDRNCRCFSIPVSRLGIDKWYIEVRDRVGG